MDVPDLEPRRRNLMEQLRELQIAIRHLELLESSLKTEISSIEQALIPERKEQ